MDIIAKVSELLERGETFCLATVITSDTADIASGSKAIVHGDGTLDGVIESQNLDPDIRDQALAALGEKKSRITEIDGGVRVFFNVLSAEARLLICGAGHIALPLARFANDVGFTDNIQDVIANLESQANIPGK